MTANRSFLKRGRLLFKSFRTRDANSGSAVFVKAPGNFPGPGLREALHFDFMLAIAAGQEQRCYDTSCLAILVPAWTLTGPLPKSSAWSALLRRRTRDRWAQATSRLRIDGTIRC